MARTRIPKVEPVAMTVDDVTDYLRTLVEMRARFNAAHGRSGSAAATYQSFVLENGRSWTPARRPRGVRKKADRQCYGNSLGVAWRSGAYRYVEGYAASGWSGIITEHAWLVDADDVVIDLTWRAPELSAYYGLVISTPVAGRYASIIGTYGVLVNDWQTDCAILRLGRLPTLDEMDEIEDARERRRERSA